MIQGMNFDYLSSVVVLCSIDSIEEFVQEAEWPEIGTALTEIYLR